MMALQTTIGNRALARAIQAGLVGASGAVAPAARVLARSTGLRRSKQVSQFADDALAYWRDRANRRKPLEDYATHLITKVNAMLKALKSFEVKSAIDTAETNSGSFSRVTWTITINPKEFSSRPNVTKVGDLTADEAAEIADTIYHESRHSEQYFQIARVQAGRMKQGTKNPGAKIAKDMSIPRDVADAAAAAPLTAAPGNEKLISEAENWESITVGRHGEYKGIVNTWKNEARELRDAVDDVTAGTVDAVKTKVESNLSDWKSDKQRLKFVKSHLSTTQKLKNKTTMDDRVVTHLTTVREKVDAFIAAATAALKKWDKADAATRLKRLKGLRSTTRAVREALYDAYRAHIHEEDAWAAGGAVGTRFRSEQAKHVTAEKAAKAKKKAAEKAKKEAAEAKKQAAAEPKKKAKKKAAPQTAAVPGDASPSAPVVADASPPPVVADVASARIVSDPAPALVADQVPVAVAVSVLDEELDETDATGEDTA